MKNKIKNFDNFQNFKKGDKVLINAEMIKNNMGDLEKLLRTSLGNHFDKEAHMKGDLTPLIYQKALDNSIATITWVENSRNDNAMVNLIFDDGFECSTLKKNIKKV